MTTPELCVTINPANIRVTAKPPTAEVGFGAPVVRDLVGGDPYTGEYVVTPTTEAQTLGTRLKTTVEDVVIKPIPSNYGRILWNGSTLTVY